MISFPTKTRRFKLDSFEFMDYGQALTKELFSRLPPSMEVEFSTVETAFLPNGETEELTQYSLDIEMDKKDIRELNFLAQGLHPDPDSLFDKIITVMYNQIHNEVKDLVQKGISKDFQKVVFLVPPGAHPIVAYVNNGMLLIQVTFKVISNVKPDN